MVKFKNILILALVFFSFESACAEKRVNFSFGNKVQVLSDKAYRRTKNNEFEAVGNVIINHESNSIYGEKASISFKTGDSEVLGNVRYISSDMTVFGSKMEYNFNTSYLGVHNGKIINSNYTVVGKYLAKISENVFIGRDAEYTTCRDCPESWSILGKEVEITKNEYIRIKHAYIKVNGVVVMYVPYIVLPIKKERESGLLFPKIKFDSNEGVHFGIPYFWAMSEHSDLTFTPEIRGKRGVSGELQFRQALRGETWLELNTIGVSDRVWDPGKDDYEVSGAHSQRVGGELEFHSFLDNTVSFHATVSGLSDLDQVRDLQDFYDDRVRSSDLGIESFLNIYNSYFDFGVEVDFKRNLLFDNPKGFDHSYVQTLPRVNLNSIPFYLFQGDFFGGKSLSFQWKSEGAIFKQNHFNEGTNIRNAMRVNLKPKVLWDLGYIGPVNFKSSISMDRQEYWFSNEKKDKRFVKSGFVYENEASFEVSKIFGLSYDESIPLERIDLEKSEGLNIETKEEDVRFEGHVGSVPQINESFTEDQYKISRNSYRYSQVYKLKHYYLSDQKQKGNQKFANQIQSGIGQFDSNDSIREKEFELSHVSSRTTLPVSNTLELQWSNSLIKKYPKKINVFNDGKYLRDNFTYTKVAYFDISQGIDFNANTNDTLDKLTRLYVGTGFSLSNFSFSLSEYFYHQNNEHILNFGITHNLSRLNYGITFRYDSFTTPINKTIDLNGGIKLNDLFNLNGRYSYDIDQKEVSEMYYQLLYSPLNNCWKADVSYKTTEIENSIAFNFYINFNENKFYSFSGGE